MPAIDQNNGPRKAKPTPKAKPVKVRVTVPDAGSSTRTTQPHTVTPDQADRQRGVQQKSQDAAVVATNVKTSRVKALGKEGRGSGTRAVKAWAKTNVADYKKFVSTDASGHHGSGKFAVIMANGPGPLGISEKLLKNAGKDAAELAVTTPSSVAKLGSDIVHHPKKVPGELVAPYVDLAKHPVKNVTEKPVSTTLMVQPIVRVPGRVLGRVARVKGAQTLARPTATLPGTALEEARTGSRDVLRRSQQAKKDAGNPNPEVTPKQVQTRVDEHFDKSKHESHRIVGEAVKAAEKATKGQPKHVREAAVEAARAQAQEDARAAGDVRFAKEFGANVRLSHGVAVREALHKVRRQAVGRLDTAKAGAKQANAEHDAALADARAALAKARSSPALSALEGQRGLASKALIDEQKSAINAKLAHERAHANARVSAATPKTTVKVKVLEGERRTAGKVEKVPEPKVPRAPAVRLPTPASVTAARGAVSAADRRLNRLSRAMQQAQEKASRLEGITVGRHAGGKMTEAAGRRVADHAHYIGELQDELRAAGRASASARERLKVVEREAQTAQRAADHEARGAHQANVREQRSAVRVAQRAASQSAKAAAKAVERQIAAERKRVSGVAPAEHQALLDAIDRLDKAPGRVAQARQRVRDLDAKIAAERQRVSGVPPAQHARLTNAIHARGQARVTLATARADAQAAAHAHIAAKQAMTNSTLVNPAGEGRLFAHKADAATVVKKLNQTAHATGAAEPMTFVLRQVGQDRWAAVPKVAANRLLKHQVVGSSPATMAKAMRVSRGAFTQATLPLSLKWLGGQASEAGIRSVLAGAGPMDWLRMGKVVKKLNAQKAGAGDELMHRVTGGHFDLAGPARDFANGKSLADEFADSPRAVAKTARAATAAGQTLPAKAVRQGWGQYTKLVLGSINHVIESNARRAMAGQAIKDLGFQDQHILGLFDKAIDEAANGLKGTHNQVALGRAVDRMYGKYSKFSPETRTLLMHWTPYLAWYMNSVKFLVKVLPVDHPVKTALVADASVAEEEWRKSHRISLNGSHVPFYMMGSYPTKDGKYRNIAHYAPGGIGADPLGAAADLMLPQFLGPLKNMGGVDWKWQRLTHGGTHGKEFNLGEKGLRAAVTAAEEQIPGVTQAGKISGVTPRYVDKNSPESIKSPGEVLKGYLPWTPMSNNEPTTGGSSTSGRVKIPGVSGGRIKIPGASSGRIKIP